MTKKSGSTAQAGSTGTDPTQNQLNELYTAHQVHTLAQLIYQQVVARRNGGYGQTPNAGTGVPSSMHGQPSMNGWTGSAQGAPQPLIYWYS